MSIARLVTLIALFAGAVVVLLLIVRLAVGSRHPRYIAAGTLLFLLGGGLTLLALHENSRRPSPELNAGVGILAPYLPADHQEFALGMAARPSGCDENVEVTIVAEGTAAYWADHPSTPNTAVPFELLLPGNYEKFQIGLGYPHSNIVNEPQQAEFYPRDSRYAKLRIRHLSDLPATPHMLTVVEGHIIGWSVTEDPLIVRAHAHLGKYRSIDSCYLQLPALLGQPSARTLFSVYGCSVLNHHYGLQVCSDPPAGGGGAAETDITSALTASRAVSVVDGGNGDEVSSTQSFPNPSATPGGNADWGCASAPAPTALPIAGSTEARARALASQSDCGTVATILGPTWPRDFALALLGAVIAVGMHFAAEGVVDSDSHPLHPIAAGLRKRLPRRKKTGEPTDKA